MNPMNEKELRLRIEKSLKEGKRELSKPEIDNLVETVNIYHQELEYQNLELRRIQEELEKSYANFTALFNNAPIGYVVCNEDLIVEKANNAFYGLVNVLNPIDKQLFTKYVHPSSQDDFYLFFRQIQKMGLPGSTEISLTRGGTWVTVKLDVNIFYEGDQRFFRFSLTDFTRENQMRLRNKHLLSVLFALKNINKLITNEKDKANLVKEAAEILVLTRGYHGAWIVLNNGIPQNSITASAGLGFDFKLLEEKIKKGETVHCIENCYKTEEVIIVDSPVKDCKKCPLVHKYENRSALAIRLAYGTRILGFISVSIPSALAHDDEEIQLFTEIAADISWAIYNLDLEFAKKQNEKEIEERDKLFRSVLKTTADGFWMLDIDGKFIEVNEAFCTMTGYSRYEIIGMHINKINDVETPDETESRIGRIVNNGSEIFETKHRRKDYTVFPVEVSATFIPEKGGMFICFGRDLTFRKQNESALKESEERFKLLSDVTLEGILIHKNGVAHDLNPSLAKMFGLSREELIGRNFLEFVHPDYLHLVAENMIKDYAHPYEIKICRSNGTCFFAEIEARNFDQNNEMLRVAAIRDITERKEDEENLRISEEKYRLLVETASDSIFLISGEGLILDANNSGLQLLGYKKDELLNQTIEVIDPNFTKEQFIEFWEKVPLNETRIFETTHRKKKGALVPVEVSGQKYHISGKTYYYGIARDITERKQAEQKIRESEETYRNIFQNARVGLFRTRVSDGKMLESNHQLALMFGYDNREELLAEYITSDNYVDAGSRERMLAEINETGYLKNFEARFYRKDRSVVWINFSAKLVQEKGWIEGVGEDITERKIILQELKSSEQNYKNLQMLFRNMADIVPDMIWAKDVDKKYIFANYSVCINLLGTDDTNEPIGKNDMYFAIRQRNLYPENPLWHTFGEGCADSDMVTIQSGETCQFDEFGYVKGKFLYLDVIKTPIRNEKGEITGVVGTARDVTESRKTHLRLLESEANLKAIIDNSLDSIWLVNKNYEIQFVNEVFVLQFLHNFGVKLEKGMNILQAIAEPYRKVWKDRYDRALKNENLIFEDIIKTNKGDVFIEVSMQPIEVDGKVTGASVYGRDITGKRKAEKEIQNAADRFRGLIENAPDGVAIINAEGTFLYASPNAKRHFGYVKNEEYNMNGMDLVHPDDIPIVLEILQKIFACSEEKATAIYRFRHYTGAYRWIETTFSNMLAHEAIQGIVMNFTDITERKKLFEEMQAAKEIAERRENEIKLKNEELLTAKEKAEESDRLKSAFLANMSHEIRTPMNGILGFTNLLSEENLTDAERQNYIGIIQKSGDRLLETVNDLIDVSKIETGQVDVVNSLTDISDTLNYLYHFFIPQSSEKNIELRLNVNLNEGNTKIFTDKVKFNSVLINLIKNAIKFTNSGFIEIGCHLQKNLLEKKSGGQNEMIVFYVRDTGIGIAKDQHETVFNRFIQAELGEARNYQGAGLGLTIAKAYTEMLGGKIWLESEIGKGSVFYFILPALYSEEPVLTKIDTDKSELKIKPRNKLKIMIAEDDENGSLYLDTILKPMNSEILHCDNGLSAVEMCKSNPDIDIILMDIRMPVLNGFDATRKIREFNPDVIIIAQTAFALAGDMENAIGAGCTDYISKPIKREELLTTISRNLEKQRKL